MSGLSIMQVERLTKAGAQVLQKLLRYHDRIVKEIAQLDEYTTELTLKAITAVKNGNKGKALQLMNRKCVADGYKYFYRQYRIKKWQQIHKLVSSIILTLNPDEPLPIAANNEDRSEVDVQHVHRFAKTMMVAHCNFWRSD